MPEKNYVSPLILTNTFLTYSKHKISFYKLQKLIFMFDKFFYEKYGYKTIIEYPIKYKEGLVYMSTYYYYDTISSFCNYQDIEFYYSYKSSPEIADLVRGILNYYGKLNLDELNELERMENTAYTKTELGEYLSYKDFSESSIY